jgi:ribosomal protein S18 acetylase RimI-like enzyme
MAAPIVKTAAAEDEAAAIDVLVLAFAADPVVRWTWRDPGVYLATFPAFARAFGGRAFAHGSGDYVEGYAGAALWLPPDVHPDEAALNAVFERSVSAAMRKDAAAMMEQMGRYHPREPHWYLPLIGVDPSYQGKGYGAALMRHALSRCDRERTPAYLESTNPRNITLYERHGFERLGTVQVGAAPPIVPMLRRAR